MKEQDVRQRITMLYERMYRLMIAKDVEGLEEILSSGFELVHMTGMHQPKVVYLRSIANGTLNYYTSETDNIIFDTILENKVVIRGQTRVLAAVFGVGKHTWPLQLRIILEKENGEWKMTKAEASTY